MPCPVGKTKIFLHIEDHVLYNIHYISLFLWVGVLRPVRSVYVCVACALFLSLSCRCLEVDADNPAAEADQRKSARCINRASEVLWGRDPSSLLTSVWLTGLELLCGLLRSAGCS